MTFSIVLLQLLLLGVIMESDLGRRKIGWFRVLRPVIAVAVIVPFFFTSLPTGHADLILQGAGALAGAALGLFAVSPLLVSVGYDPAWLRRGFRTARARRHPAAVSHAGAGYAALWIAVTAIRLGFAYGAQHVFPGALGHFLVSHQLSSTALGNAFIFLAIGMDLFRSAGLWTRGRHQLAVAAQGPAALRAHAAGGAR